MRTTPRLLALAAWACVSIVATVALARVELDGDDVPTVFSIRKSANRNRVDFGLRLGPDCRAEGSEPVFAYWRMLERGPDALEALEPFERRAYGIASQEVEADGARVLVRLHAVPGRVLVFAPRKVRGRCLCHATLPIGGRPSILEDVFVVLSGPLAVDHIELRGRSLDDGAERVERLER
ncbi:MAG: DUF4833 domain-containing protein [Polyangiales bacterium]